MATYKRPITLETALKEVTEERFCKGHHYKDVALTDEMVAQIVQVKSLVNMGFINTAITDEALQYLATLPKLKLLFLEDNKQVTGEGFKYFADKPIGHISLDGCPVTDETLKIVLQVPRLKSLFTIAAHGSEELGWHTFYFQLYDAISGSVIAGGNGSFSYLAK